MKRQSTQYAAILAILVTTNLKASLFPQNECPHREYLHQVTEPVAKVDEILTEEEQATRASGKVTTSFAGVFGGYSEDGVQKTSFPSGTQSQSSTGGALQTDGKFIAVGSLVATGGTYMGGIVRYVTNGEIDTSFGTQGTLTETLQQYGGFSRVALQSDGRILVFGSEYVFGTSQFLARRYLANGTLDASFHTDGKLNTTFPGSNSAMYFGGLALQSDGKAVASGTGSILSGNPASLVVVRYLTNGSVDNSFDTDGMAIYSGGQGNGGDIFFQTDGRILVNYSPYSTGAPFFGMARYLSNGKLDASFSGDGIAIHTTSGSEWNTNIALQTDGTTLQFGTLQTARDTFRFLLVKYLTSGTLDQSFGTDGWSVYDVGSGTNFAHDMALDGSGKIVLTGGYHGNLDFKTMRLLANGVLDTTFSGDGMRTTTHTGGQIVLQPDGKISLVGWSSPQSAFAVIRYLSNGELDAAEPYSESANRVVAQSDDKLIVAGAVGGDIGLSRYLLNGTLDTTFEGDGKISAALGAPSNENGLALQSDGKVVVAGRHSSRRGYDFGVYRYLSNGTLDNTLDSDGKVSTDFSAGEDSAAALTLQTDGKILAAGKAYISSENRIAVARYLSNGVLDNTFDGDGKQNTDAGSNSVARCVVPQTDGKVVAVGDNGADLAVVRYLANGVLDAGFSDDGIQTTNVNGTDSGYGCALQSDGKILASGYNTCWGYFMTRYLSNGVLDTSFSEDGKKVIPNIGLYASQSIVALSDGRILGVGKSGNNGAILRLLSNGTLDNNFGYSNGIQPIEFGRTTTGLNGLAVTADGRILAAGSTGIDFTVARCQSCGPLDVTFGSSREGLDELSKKESLNEAIRACRSDKDYLTDLYWEKQNADKQ
jgi:uncharacterized delta-60 repeat protein